MTLESKLFELTTLVDYGTYYLRNRMLKADELMPEEILKRMDGQDVIQYLLDDGWDEYMLNHMDVCEVTNYIAKYDTDGVLDEIGSYDICKWLRDNACVEDVLDNMNVSTGEVLDGLDIYTIKEYARNHFDADDIYDVDDMLDCIPEQDIKDYVRNAYDVNDWVCTDWI